jgi:hypothetical protein
LQRLTDELCTIKSDPRLAYNDALVALAVYGRRLKRHETSSAYEFGWGTWWLTGESKILSKTKALVRKHRARYIMRPDFLLNFLTLAPSAHETREAFKNIFPSMLGIQLARRMSSTAFAEVMDRVREAEQLDDGRRAAEMAKLTNELKSDMRRGYIRTGNKTASPADTAAGRAAASRVASADAAP